MSCSRASHCTKGAKHEYYPTHGAGLLLQSLKTVESPETYKGEDSAVAAVTVMIALVHFFYVGYFFWQLLVACMSQWPDVFVKLYPPRPIPSPFVWRCIWQQDS